MTTKVSLLTLENCEEWKKNKNINPLTKRKIATNTTTYKNIEKKCHSLDKSSVLPVSNQKDNGLSKKSKLHRALTKEDCDKWTENKLKKPKNPKNPITNWRITNTSAIYKELDSRCNDIYDKIKQGLTDVNDNNETIFKNKNVIKNKKTTDIYTLEECIEWEKNHKKKNPKTNFLIKENNAIYKKIENQCAPILKEYHNNSKKNIQKVDKIDEDIVYPNIIAKDIVKDNDYDNPKILHYPDLDDEDFAYKLSKLYEYYLHKVPELKSVKSKTDFDKISNDMCGVFEKTYYQYLISNYVSTRSPYRSVLLYHGVGVGKTCSAITLSEGFLHNHSMYKEPQIWVIMPLSLKNSFKEQIFSMLNFENFSELAQQCTGDLYIKLANILKEGNKEKIALKIKKLIKSRYRLFTYESFATFIETEYIQKNITVKDKVIIVDEAHNIRSTTGDNPEKRVYVSLVNALSSGDNNKLVLLSATPMYNKPEDIFDLLYLLVLNDKRKGLLKLPYPSFFDDNNKINTSTIELFKKLSGNYISYLRGKNPFTFALKLSPKYNNVRLLQKEFDKDSNNKIISETNKNWLSSVEDGIVISQLGEYQKKYVSKMNEIDDNSVFNNLQPMNIVYDDMIGDKGFNKIFSRTDKSNSLLVKYNKKYLNLLYPSEDKLGRYSGKFLNICNILKNSHGIVVIYSAYIWSGIIPLAICLEHLGYNREGAPNILQNPDIIQDAPKYNNKSPKYCILSSENSEVMGSSSIDNLIKIINSPKNIDGSLVKVILITPVASEGLSFYNVREMHLIEPWFHFNKVAQIIGRGIRNCRHKNLPLEERNVTVYMHAGYDNDEKETADIHAFRIASKKMIQSNIIDKVIRDNSLDCFLMKNINYFPKSIFELGKIKIVNSQNNTIEYEYGDDEYYQPKCKDISDTSVNKSAFRKDIYKHFIFALQIKIKQLLLKCINKAVWYISFDKIKEALEFDDEIINQAIQSIVYPNTLIEGYYLITHENGIHIVNINEENNVKLRLTYKNSQENIKPKKNSQNKFSNLMNKNIDDATISLYLYLNNSSFEELVKKIITADDLEPYEENIANILYRQGALIANKELKSIKTSTKKYIGYVNIFNNKFEPIIYSNNVYRDLIEKEIGELLSNRIKIERPDNMANETVAWGIINTITDKKTNIITNVFKVLTPGNSIGVKTGIVCSSLNKQDMRSVIERMGIPYVYDTKIENCNYIARELLKMKRISINPEYKPK